MINRILMMALWASAAFTMVRSTPDVHQQKAVRSNSSANSEAVMRSISAKYQANTRASLSTRTGCTNANIQVRKEWANLRRDEKLNYINAVKCLASLPARTASKFAPGAKTRYDDFVVAHLINTRIIHLSGFLLPWHRHFVWELEQALRNECNYNGTQPYTDWSKWAFQNTTANPLYDGSPTSLSGDGVAIPHNATTQQLPGGNPPPVVVIEPGQGGGCVYNGPFTNWTLHLGPVNAPNGTLGKANPQQDGLGYNARCLRRDFNPNILQNLASWSVVANGMVNYTNIHTFHPWVENVVHVSGHIFIGGENSDLFTSPNDPLFFFHHAWLDRLWAMWQALDFSSRTYALDGTHTFLNYPPSANVTLDDVMYFSPTFQNITIGEVMSPTKNKYCYIYE